MGQVSIGQVSELTIQYPSSAKSRIFHILGAALHSTTLELHEVIPEGSKVDIDLEVFPSGRMHAMDAMITYEPLYCEYKVF